jgi:O-antigen ligase
LRAPCSARGAAIAPGNRNSQPIAYFSHVILSTEVLLPSNMHRLVKCWERGLIAALWLSVALLGVGRLEIFGPKASVSAWSVSRTTFFFWFLWKLLQFYDHDQAPIERFRLKALAPLHLFFIAVTLSLLPDFHQAGDYRYFFFGYAHAIMIVDVFSATPQRRWLPVLLGLLPIVLVLRGFLRNPAILDFSLNQRFGYPLDHANTAGYLLAMSLPLCVAVALTTTAWRLSFALVSGASQMLALVLTFSRGAWLGWTASMIYLATALKKLKMITAFMLVPVACALVFPEVQNRLDSVTRPGEDPAMQERLQRFKSSLQLGIDHPILGVGYGRGRLKEFLPSYLKGTILEGAPVLHTHNVYVELFAETGTIGLLTFLWLLGQTLWRLWRRALASEGAERLMGWGLAASWVAAMVTGLGDIPFYHHGTRIFFFTLFALAHMYYTDIGDTAR